MEMVGDVKCYHCGHISGQIEGTKEAKRKALVLTAFKPRPGYEGPQIRAGDKLRCERCEGPVFLEDLRKKPTQMLPVPLPSGNKQRRRTRGKAA